VKIAVDQPAESAVPLRPGMSVDVTIETGAQHGPPPTTSAATE
jgi:multidrug resistance efflux pump